MRGIVITTDLTMETKDFGQPLYKTVGEAVGGWIEIVHPKGLPRPLCFICNEEGLLKDLPMNAVGSLWYGTLQHGCPIAGNIVVMKEGMTDDGPDIVGLTDGDIIWVKEIAIKSSGGFLIDLDTEEVKQNG